MVQQGMTGSTDNFHAAPRPRRDVAHSPSGLP
jgi:hypothetical protein